MIACNHFVGNLELASAPVVTADARILDHPHVKTVW